MLNVLPLAPHRKALRWVQIFTFGELARDLHDLLPRRLFQERHGFDGGTGRVSRGTDVGGASIVRQQLVPLCSRSSAEIIVLAYPERLEGRSL
jgi:hypothetical protein